MRTFSAVALFLVLASLVSATYPSFIVEAPSQVCAGQDFSITIRVGHPNQQGFHFLDVMRLYVNDAVVKEWTYGTSTSDYWNESYSMSLNSDAYVKVNGHCTVTGWSTFSELGTKKISVVQCGSANPSPIQVSAAPPAVIQRTAAPSESSPASQPASPSGPEANTMFLGVIALALIAALIALAIVWKKFSRLKEDAGELREARGKSEKKRKR